MGVHAAALAEEAGASGWKEEVLMRMRLDPGGGLVELTNGLRYRCVDSVSAHALLPPQQSPSRYPNSVRAWGNHSSLLPERTQGAERKAAPICYGTNRVVELLPASSAADR